ncbi:unnamed protein product [Adineta ricciae]|uniref:Uncharacterized protein n=1 Tax=Adineta ricciae TaxID=249248 RepID=A0A815GY04_ADIRI|nr:unnamed protein product [Adineta ricciae]
MAEISKQCCRKVKNKLMPIRFEGPLDLPLHIIEMKTGVEPAISFVVLIGFISIYLIFGWCNDFVCNFIGLIYPVYASQDRIFVFESDANVISTFWIG